MRLLFAPIERKLGSARRHLLTTLVPDALIRSRKKAIAKHSQSLRALPDKQKPFLEDLKRNGFVRTSIGELAAASFELPVSYSALFADHASNRIGKDKSDVDLYVAGLDHDTISFAEAYLGLPVLYLGASLKVEKADGRTVGTRRWHCDIEDQSMLRILIYLRDVDSGSGPLQLLDDNLSKKLSRGRPFRSGLLKDSHPEQLQGGNMVECTGKSGTAILFDGARLYHRASPPIKRDRYSLTFSYSSRRPLQLLPSGRPTEEVFRKIAARVAEDQLRCVPAPR